MASSTNTPRQIDLRDVGLRVFSSPKEMREWSQGERRYWGWVSNAKPQDPNVVSAVHSHLRDFYTAIDNVLNNAGDSDDDQTLARVETNVRSAIAGWMARRSMVFSNSPEAKYLDDLNKRSRSLAVHAAAAMLGVKVHGESPEGMEGPFLAFAFRNGLIDRTDGELASLQELHTEWNNLLEDARNIQRAAKSQQDDLGRLAADQSTAQREAFDQLRQRAENDLALLAKRSEEQMKHSDEELRKIERTYDERLALQSSVRYWKTKATGHANTAQRLAWACGIVGVGVTIMLGVETYLIIGPLQKIIDLQVWKGAVLLLTAALGIWAVRILVRLLLSNLHLKSEAVERRTMLLTYLALLRDDDGPSKDQRELILQILFRPSATGIIKDEALPPGIAQWLNVVTRTDA